MEKAILLTNLDELLKDMHYSNLPFRRLAIKSIEAVCADSGKEEYRVYARAEDTDFFFRQEPWTAGAKFKAIFNKIGIKVDGVTESTDSGGFSIKFKSLAN